MSAQEPRVADHRSEPRLKVFRIGRAQAGGTEFKVHLLDISAQGARLHAGQALGPGIRMTLTCSAVRTTGEVRWVDASRAGIRFDVPLIASELDTIVAAG